ncbi:hypothetical protein TNCV_3495101 [Trichonephila clavipes]|nr:hypothetical protein TNCV_3495101 [Trichonephila clavipes]
MWVRRDSTNLMAGKVVFLRGLLSPIRVVDLMVAAIRDISRSCLDPNDFTVLNCIVKGHAFLSPRSLRLRLCSRFTLLAT